ncbi:MAG: ABC transporter substrate-binding protein, partial [Crenarchaeota archaeon]|nr:ABC transporter substrate-binding protein [Thermoproteota archaeon]
YALGAETKIIGRSDTCSVPSMILTIPSVGSSSSNPSMELMLELEPELIIADGMLSSKTEILNQLADLGIPVYIDSCTNGSRVTQILETLGQILDKKEIAQEISDWMNYYINLVDERIATIPQNERYTVYVEVLSTIWRSANTDSNYGLIINLAGGLNIAPLNTSSTLPTLSPEYVIEQNPNVIIKMVSQNPVGSLEDLQTVRTEMLNRDVLSDVDAVLNDRVFVFNSKLTQGIQYPISLLYLAKCMYPDLFSDIDPGQLLENQFQKYIGMPPEGVYLIP